MAKRDRIRIRQLDASKTEFRELLVCCLRQCAGGRWGLFGAYDRFPEIRHWLNWPEAERLRELANSIQLMLAESGERYELCDEFFRLCTFHKPNDPGEPKLAKSFLDRIENRSAGLEG